jgi:hypothetical protein
MASRETVSLSFKADIGDLKREIGSIPGITKTEAAKMVRELETGYNRAERAAKKAAQATKTSWSDVATGLSSVKGLVFDAGTAIVAFGQRMADLNNQLTDTATRTGLTIEQVAGLKLAAEGSGVQFASLEKQLNQLPKVMLEVANGGGRASAAFERMGIDVRDAATGGLRPASEVLPEIFEGLNRLPDAATKSATAMKIFGVEAGGALIQSGAIENLDAFVTLADQFGIETGPRAAQAAGDFQRQMATLSLVTDGELFKLISRFGGPGGMGDVIGLVNGSVIVLGSTFGAVFDEINKQVQSIFGPLTEVALKVIDGDLSGALKAAQRNAAEFGHGLLGLAPNVMPLRLAAAAGRGIGEGLTAAREASEALNRTLASTPRAPGASTGGGGGGTGGTDTAKAEAAALREQAAAAERLVQIQEASALAVMGAQERINEEYRRQIEAIDLLEEQSGAHAEAELARNAVALETSLKTRELQEEGIRKLRQMEDRRADEELAHVRAVDAARRQATDLWLSSVGSVAMALSNSFAEGSAAAKGFFIVSQGVAMAQAIIQSRAASMAALAPPPLGLGPVAGAPLAVATRAAGAVQAGLIAAQTVTAFADTPRPMLAGPQGMTATFAPGDRVIAGRDDSDLVRQMQRAGIGTGGGAQVIVRDADRHHGRYGRDPMRPPERYNPLRARAGRIPGRR